MEKHEAIVKFDPKTPVNDEQFDQMLIEFAEFLLFDTKWEPIFKQTTKLREVIPILEDVPMVCKGKDCPYADKCPLISKLNDNEILGLVGSDCRIDRVEALKQFSSLVKELDINPNQATDILNVTSLVRLYIFKRRIDWQIALDGMMTKEPGAVNQRTGQVYWKEAVHPLYKENEKLEKQISALQTQLMASRKDRAQLASVIGKGNSFLKDIFTRKPEILEADFEEEEESNEFDG